MICLSYMLVSTMSKSYHSSVSNCLYHTNTENHSVLSVQAAKLSILCASTQCIGCGVKNMLTRSNFCSQNISVCSWPLSTYTHSGQHRPVLHCFGCGRFDFWHIKSNRVNVSIVRYWYIFRNCACLGEIIVQRIFTFALKLLCYSTFLIPIPPTTRCAVYRTPCRDVFT